MAKDRLNPCIHYVCKGETCKKGFKDVTLAKCKTCEKYRPRKSGQKQESVKQKRMTEMITVNEHSSVRIQDGKGKSCSRSYRGYPHGEAG